MVVDYNEYRNKALRLVIIEKATKHPLVKHCNKLQQWFETECSIKEKQACL